MFKYNCSIRKNTSILRDKLKNIGYIFNSEADKKNGNSLETSYMGNVISYNKDFYNSTSQHIIDCDYNEDMFIAICSLRNDTDFHQYFIIDNKWYLCLVDDLSIANKNKATIEDIISHFSK